MRAPLYDLLPTGDATTDELLGRFLDFVDDQGLTLYAAQEEAILALFEGQNVILNTPTGSGKSLVASALHFAALARRRRSVYTCPIKALVNEKWMALCRDLGPANVGLSTGDASVHRKAPVLCCTAEVLSNIALREGEDSPFQDVVMDEFHWYADRDRGVAWQVPLLTLPRTRFLLMSATLGDVAFFADALTRLNGLPTAVVRSDERPVPLSYAYSEIPIAQTLETLVAERKAPVYVVHFTQKDAAASAQDFTSLDLSTRDEKNAVAEAIAGVRFASPYGPTIRKWLKQGIGLHHAGLLPRYRVLVERLAQRGLLKVICGTDTLGVGINVPIRTVLFSRLCKFDGQKTAVLSARDFHQIAGRAGRKGFDERGDVVVQAPEYAIENLRLLEKSKDGKKFVRRKPPEHNFAHWDVQTFRRLVGAPPERLASRFEVSHGMLLNVLSRESDGCRAMRSLIRDSHETDRAKTAHVRRGWQLFRALVSRGVVEIVPRTPSGSRVRVNVTLQDDFSMNQTLSLYLLETLPLLDAASETYPLDVLTLVESILEDPDLILRRQLDKVKDRAIAEMKAEGLDYDQRMEKLETLEYPKPLREFIYSTFNAFADHHPWVGEENIRPKSIAREMFEGFRSFDDYVQEYGLERAEGLLLRHLDTVYKVLVQTVPDGARTEGVVEAEFYLRDMLRRVDATLLEEWERMAASAESIASAGDTEGVGAIARAGDAAPGDIGPPDVTRDRRGFTAAIRARAFAFLRAWSTGRDAAALESIGGTGGAVDPAEPGSGGGDEPVDHAAWTADRLAAVRAAYLQEHGSPRLDPEARNLRHTHVLPSDDGGRWRVQQTIVDPDGFNDWIVEFQVDLAASRQAGQPAMRLMRIESLAETR